MKNLSILAICAIAFFGARSLSPLGVNSAHADSVASCTLTEILATNEKDPGKRGLDPKLSRFKSKLTKGPFAAWNTFKLIGEQSVSAQKDHPVNAKLVPGGKLTLLVLDFVVSQAKTRLRVRFDLDDKQGKRIASTTVVFDSGDGVPLAGEPYSGGTYILLPICNVK